MLDTQAALGAELVADVDACASQHGAERDVAGDACFARCTHRTSQTLVGDDGGTSRRMHALHIFAAAAGFTVGVIGHLCDWRGVSNCSLVVESVADHVCYHDYHSRARWFKSDQLHIFHLALSLAHVWLAAVDVRYACPVLGSAGGSSPRPSCTASSCPDVHR